MAKRIRVNNVVPAIVETKLAKNLVRGEKERISAVERNRKKLLVPEIGKPQDMQRHIYIYFMRADYRPLLLTGEDYLAKKSQTKDASI